MDIKARVYVAGHTGLIGSAIVRRLKALGYHDILLKTHGELDLTDRAKTEAFFGAELPEYVFLAAAKVGGIYANNTYPADFIHNNLMIQTNVIHLSYKYKVKKLLFFGSSCMYPKECPQPIKEEYLLSGQIEPTNEPYAVAKIAGVKMCQSYNRQHGTNFITVVPATVFGTNDHFNLYNSHVIQALMMKFHEAKVLGQDSVVVWGTGRPRREFIYVDDVADACVFLMDRYDGSKIIHVGVGTDISVRELAGMIKEVVGFKGQIVYDETKPDGIPERLLDSSRITTLGWRHKTQLREGLELTYKWFEETCAIPTSSR